MVEKANFVNNKFSGWARNLQGAALLCSVAAIASALFTFAVSRDILSATPVTETWVTLGMFFATGFFAVTNIWFMVSLLGFGLRAAQFVRDHGVTLRLKPGWAVGGWFVPIAQMFLPFIVLNDVAGTGAGQEAAARKRSLLWFWIWFVVLNQLSGYSLGEIISPDLATQFQGYQLYAGVLAFNIVPLMMARKLFGQIDADLRSMA
jgi:hypothetical protein